MSKNTQGLSDKETELANEIEAGEPCNLNGPSKPSQDEAYTSDHVVRAEVIRCLLIGTPLPGEKEARSIHHKGVQLSRAKIKGKLDLSFAEIKVPLVLQTCRLDEGIDLTDARTRRIDLSGSWTAGLNASGATIDGSLFLGELFCCEGGAKLPGVTIEGPFVCSGGKFMNDDGVALNINAGIIKGGVFLDNDFKCCGIANFIGCKMRELECAQATFRAPGKIALLCDRVMVDGNVHLRFNFNSEGEVRFRNASIKGDFNCVGGQFENAGETALNLRGIDVGGDIIIRQVGCRDEPALKADNLTYSNVDKTRINGCLDLTAARCRTLNDDSATWPEQGNLILDGFVYKRIGGDVLTAEERRGWLKRQPCDHLTGSFRPQPWEQLVKVLRTQGHEKDARRIAFLKRQQIRKSGGLSGLSWLGNFLLEITVGYGYRTWIALLVCIILFAGGWASYWTACPDGPAVESCLMEPALSIVYISPEVAKKGLPEPYPQFYPSVYSLDVVVPVFDLHQEIYWQPKSEVLWLHIVRWVQIVFGWIFVSLLVFALSGLIRKD